jgi:hypothetical protein
MERMSLCSRIAKVPRFKESKSGDAQHNKSLDASAGACFHLHILTPLPGIAMIGRFLLSLIVLSLAPVCLQAQPLESAARETEEYAVYSATIATYAYEESGIFLIANPTVNWTEPIRIKQLRFLRFESAPDLSPETVDDFMQRNKTNRWLASKLEIERKYVLVDFREIKRLAGNFSPFDQDWKALFSEYPGAHGFVNLSRVGFNQQIDQAFVHIGWNCPGLCGHWSFLLLAKKDGLWKLVGEANRVIS